MKKMIAALMAALRGDDASVCAGIRRRIAGTRRVAFVGVVLWVGWNVAEVAHFEVIHESCKAGLDGLIAFLIERVCSVE